MPNPQSFWQEDVWPIINNLISLGKSTLRLKKVWTTDFDGSGVVTVPTPVNTTDATTKAYVDSLLMTALTIEEVDAAPSIASATKLSFDQADGFVVTNPAGAQVRVDLAAVPNAALANSAITLSNGTGITITGSPVSLGGTATVNIISPVTVATGGTGLTSGTSGGVLGYTASGTLASSAALTLRGLVVGGGAGATPTSLAAMTNGQLPIGSTGANPVPATLTAGIGVAVTNAAGAITIDTPNHLGQCRLNFTNTTTLTLIPYAGQLIQIQGVLYKIPSGGVTLSNASSVANTTYLIYAYISGGNVTLEYSATAHATDTTAGNVGVEIKSADATRTLVGMARTQGSTPGQWQAAPLTVSYFNRRMLSGLGTFSADRTTTSTTYVEINTEIETNFLTWSDEDVFAASNGSMENTGAAWTSTGIAFDGSTLEVAFDSTVYIDTATGGGPIGLSGWKTGLAEGFHYATLLGRVSVSTGTWRTATSSNKSKTYLHVAVRG